MNKKAFELSATFLVILIITIVIFTGGIFFIRKFFATAEEMRGTIDQQTQAQIESLLLEQGSVVAFPLVKKTVDKGKDATFGLGIKNILEEEKDFSVSIAFKRAYTVNEEIMGSSGTNTGTPDPNYIDSKWVFTEFPAVTISPNDLQMIPILVRVDSAIADGVGTEKGTYEFNVCVFSTSTVPFDCANPNLGHPDLYPPRKINKLYVTVP